MACVKPSAWSAAVSFSSRPWSLQLSTLVFAFLCPRSFAIGAATHLNRNFGRSRTFRTVSSFRSCDSGAGRPGDDPPCPACLELSATLASGAFKSAIASRLRGFHATPIGAVRWLPSRLQEATETRLVRDPCTVSSAVDGTGPRQETGSPEVPLPTRCTNGGNMPALAACFTSPSATAATHAIHEGQLCKRGLPCASRSVEQAPPSCGTRARCRRDRPDEVR